VEGGGEEEKDGKRIGKIIVWFVRSSWMATVESKGRRGRGGRKGQEIKVASMEAIRGSKHRHPEQDMVVHYSM